jgi:hypothetical protein
MSVRTLTIDGRDVAMATGSTLRFFRDEYLARLKLEPTAAAAGR